MDCSICTTMPLILRPPRNSICAACYEGARTLIALISKFDADKSSIDKSTISISLSNSTYKGLGNIVKWVKEMKEKEEDLNEKVNFLAGGFESAFTLQLHTDILLKPSHNAPPIPAHKALLAAKSEIFKNMLDSDACKEAPNDVVTLHELNHDELESLVHFLYTGTLPPQKVAKHIYSLSIAADKYEISYLQKFCERHMLSTLNTSNALDVLEISDICSNTPLKEIALSFIVKNLEDIVYEAKFEAFALKNPHLCVQITRASLIDLKNRRNGV